MQVCDIVNSPQALVLVNPGSGKALEQLSKRTRTLLPEAKVFLVTITTPCTPSLNGCHPTVMLGPPSIRGSKIVDSAGRMVSPPSTKVPPRLDSFD